MIQRIGSVSITLIYFLIRRITYYCFNFHVFAYEVVNFLDEKFGLVFDFVDKVFGCPHIRFPFAEAKKGPTSDGFRHWCLADNIDVFRNCRVPDCLMFFKGFRGEHCIAQSGAVDIIRKIEWV